jgi:hypothetical protein
LRDVTPTLEQYLARLAARERELTEEEEAEWMMSHPVRLSDEKFDLVVIVLRLAI